MSKDKDDRLDIFRRHFPGVDTKSSFRAVDYLHLFGTPLHALLYRELFAPPIRDSGEAIFFACFRGPWERLESVMEQVQTDVELSAVERSWNYVLLTNLLYDWDLERAEETETFAAHLIDAWRAWLQAHYPGRTFCFETSPFDEGVGVEAITWWTDRGHTRDELLNAQIPNVFQA